MANRIDIWDIFEAPLCFFSRTWIDGFTSWFLILSAPQCFRSSLSVNVDPDSRLCRWHSFIPSHLFGLRISPPHEKSCDPNFSWVILKYMWWYYFGGNDKKKVKNREGSWNAPGFDWGINKLNTRTSKQISHYVCRFLTATQASTRFLAPSPHPKSNNVGLRLRPPFVVKILTI
jgi:hypothetical protein